MRYSVVFAIILLVIFVSNSVFAQNTLPFASSFKSEIINYNKSTSTLATSGRLGDGALDELAKKGIKTIIDLRTVAEGIEDEKTKAEALGLKYINIPVRASGIEEKQLQEFANILETAEKPILLHCASGNRAGAMLTSYYLEKGIPIEQAVEIGRTAGMKPMLEAIVLTKCKKCK